MRHGYSYIIILVAILFHAPLFAQESKDTIAGRIQWSEARQVGPGEFLFEFDGAVNFDEFGLLPVLQLQLPALEGQKYSEASLLEGVFEELNVEDESVFLDVELIRNDPQLVISAHRSGNHRLDVLNVLPLRKTRDGRGIERLVSYRIGLQTESFFPESNREGGNRFALNSVLRTGEWYKVSVIQTGIYKITYEDLQSMGIDPDQLDPRKLQIFGNGSGMLEEAVAGPRTDDLMENSILVVGEEDGVFDTDDYILFYGEGPVQVKYNPFFQKLEHEVNFYTDETYYFLTYGQSTGKRITPAEDIPAAPTDTVTTFEDLVYHQKDELNLIKSGQIWYGEVFNTQLDHTFDFTLSNLDITQPLYLKANLAGRSTQNTEFQLLINGELLETIDVPSVVLGSSIYARALTSNYEQFSLTGENLQVGVTFEKPGTTDMGWLNYIEVNFIRKLVFEGGQLSFRDARSTGSGKIGLYRITASGQGLSVWDVTDISAVRTMRLSQAGPLLEFKASADILKEYIAFDPTGYLPVDFVEKVENQNLHSIQPADFVIVAYPDFLEQASRLADFHRQQDGMSVIIVTPQQIYNEFSSGAQDVTAIRDFMKMLYDRRQEGARPGYLLLFGDASFDFKGILPEDNNLVPAYQSRESLKMAASFVTDDYFGCLDEDEGSNGSGTVDIGIGRFPVHTLEQAEQAVDKVFRYAALARENFGPWRNSICFVADDEDNNIHLNQGEGLSLIADSLGTVFNVSKVYLDAYAQLQTPSGTRYPDANQAIDRSVNNGSLLVNYTGHGGEIGWASERVLDIPAIQAYQNMHNMPAFVTATCEFSRYDDPGLISAGELVFLNPEGAGIGLFTTTRLAYSQSNYTLNKRFYYEAFQLDSLTGEYPRMGDLIRVSKTPSNQNIKNFVLLGDPALMLAYPKFQAVTINIVNDNNGRPSDTIHALSTVTISGRIQDLNGNPITEFDGKIYPTVFDKPVIYKTRGNDPSSKVTEFNLQDKVLYKGEATVENGEFIFSFIVPKDISYQYGLGKISYYAVDTVLFNDASGYDHVWIGGSDPLAQIDDEGPEIELFLNHYDFRSGDITTPAPILIARLFDESGINTVGNGIGHDIVAVVDGNYMESVVLNDYFSPSTDSYQGGEVLYQLGTFANGKHSLTLKAWDVFNNSSEATIEFVVNTGAQIVITGVQVQPNPMQDATQFVFDHNKPGEDLDVSIHIYSLMGQMSCRLDYSFNTENLKSIPFTWYGRNSSGDELPSGLYVYHIRVTSADGTSTEVTQKLMISR